MTIPRARSLRIDDLAPIETWRPLLVVPGGRTLLLSLAYQRFARMARFPGRPTLTSGLAPIETETTNITASCPPTVETAIIVDGTPTEVYAPALAELMV